MKSQIRNIIIIGALILLSVSAPISSFAACGYDEQILTDPDNNPRAFFGYSVSAADKFVIVGALSDYNYPGSAYIFKRGHNGWIQAAKLMSDDSSGYFGGSVSMTNRYAIVGATGSNSAYMFKRDGDLWIQQTKLVPLTQPSAFGISVSTTDNFAIVGATSDNENGESAGAAYIFERNGKSWVLAAKLVASDGADHDYFGVSVSITNNYAIVGSLYGGDSNGSAGAAYIFERDGDTWTETAKLTSQSQSHRDGFGHSVSATKNYVVVGAYADNENGEAAGAAYIFKHIKHKRNGWIQVAKLKASDGFDRDQFGWSVSAANNYVIIGTPQGDEDYKGPGAAYLFKLKRKKHHKDAWIQVAKLTPSDGTNYDFFGKSVSASDDYFIIGGLEHKAYLYERECGKRHHQHCKKIKP